MHVCRACRGAYPDASLRDAVCVCTLHASIQRKVAGAASKIGGLFSGSIQNSRTAVFVMLSDPLLAGCYSGC